MLTTLIAHPSAAFPGRGSRAVTGSSVVVGGNQTKWFFGEWMLHCFFVFDPSVCPKQMVWGR
jgi:hypothetical protein